MAGVAGRSGRRPVWAAPDAGPPDRWPWERARVPWDRDRVRRALEKWLRAHGREAGADEVRALANACWLADRASRAIDEGGERARWGKREAWQVMLQADAAAARAWRALKRADAGGDTGADADAEFRQ